MEFFFILAHPLAIHCNYRNLHQLLSNKILALSICILFSLTFPWKYIDYLKHIQPNFNLVPVEKWYGPEKKKKLYRTTLTEGK